MRQPTTAPDCATFGCIGVVRCDYCGGLIDSADARTVLVAAGRLRRGDLHGALRLLQGATHMTPAPTGPVGSTSTAATAGATTP